MKDIHFLRSKGAEIKNMELFKEREKITYDYGHPKLNVSKDAFFNGDGIQYIYDHDTIPLITMKMIGATTSEQKSVGMS